MFGDVSWRLQASSLKDAACFCVSSDADGEDEMRCSVFSDSFTSDPFWRRRLCDGDVSVRDISVLFTCKTTKP